MTAYEVAGTTFNCLVHGQYIGALHRSCPCCAGEDHTPGVYVGPDPGPFNEAMIERELRRRPHNTVDTFSEFS